MGLMKFNRYMLLAMMAATPLAWAHGDGDHHDVPAHAPDCSTLPQIRQHRKSDDPVMLAIVQKCSQYRAESSAADDGRDHDQDHDHAAADHTDDMGMSHRDDDMHDH